jgi:soluble lytic murein transglycosylase
MRPSFAAALGTLLFARALGAEEARPSPRGPGAVTTDKTVAFDSRWIEPYFASGTARAAAERFRLDDARGAAEGFARAIKQMPAAAPERLPALYMLAQARMSLDEWTAAGTIFEELHGKYPLLAPYHAHYAARARLRRGDTAGALEWAARVPAKTVLEAETVLIKIDAFAATQRWSEVEALTGQFLERFPNGPRRAEAMFRRAEALENLGRSPAEVAAVFRRVWAEAPLEVWSRRSEERLSAIAARVLEPERAALKSATAQEWLTRAMVFFDRNQNAEAETAFGAALAASPSSAGELDADAVCKAKYHRAQSIFKQRQRPRAAPEFAAAQEACRQAGNKDLLVKALYQGARCLATAGDRAAALTTYARLEEEAADHSYADDARLRAAEIHTDTGDHAKAAELLGDLPKRYPSGDQRGEALWRLALGAIRAGRWDEAHRWLDENLRLIPREEIWYAEGRALYWKARAYVRQGRRSDALGFYRRAAREYPLSIYAFLALERMRHEFPEARRELVRELRAGLSTPGGRTDWRFAPQPVFAAPEFRRAVELARMGLGGDARRELARIGFSAPDSRDAARRGQSASGREDLQWITAILLDRGRSWAAAHAIPRYSALGYRRSYPAGLESARWRIAYPRAFPEIVALHSKQNGVPEMLQLAIMREESAFNPRIESFANALGLTQMLVKTAQRFSDGPVTRETLFDPVKNVQLGSRFLSFLLQRYGGLVPLAVSGYNAGEGATDRWLRERGDLELDEFLETIPYDETRNYTKRVLSSYLTYAWLYAPERPIPELSFSVKPPREHVGRPASRPAARRPGR